MIKRLILLIKISNHSVKIERVLDPTGQPKLNNLNFIGKTLLKIKHEQFLFKFWYYA